MLEVIGDTGVEVRVCQKCLDDMVAASKKRKAGMKDELKMTTKWVVVAIKVEGAVLDCLLDYMIFPTRADAEAARLKAIAEDKEYEDNTYSYQILSLIEAVEQ